jgi:hypothetical protein
VSQGAAHRICPLVITKYFKIFQKKTEALQFYGEIAAKLRQNLVIRPLGERLAALPALAVVSDRCGP